MLALTVTDTAPAAMAAPRQESPKHQRSAWYEHTCRLTKLPVTAMSSRAEARPRQEGMMVHFRPSLSATKDAGMTPTKLTTAMAANSSPAQPNTHRVNT